MQESIFIKGARENNLKNIDVEIPRDKLVVITGLSGSGKSSLAFDTIYAEGQRRYVESLSSYARMFLGQMDKPDVDYIDGLSPAISIDQKTTSKNPRSTVGTVTEIYDYLRLLWARVGVPHCPKCGREIKQQSIDQIVDQIMALPEGTRIQILAPVVRARKGEHVKILEDAKKSGYVRARIDGILYELSEEIKLEKNKKHNIEIVVDRLVIKPEIGRRLTDSAETALALAGGLMLVDLVGEDRQISFSQNYACEDCGISIEELAPRLFSFNNPYGACPTCTGLGVQLLVDPQLIMPNPNLSIMDGGICASGWGNVKGDSISRMYFEALARRYHFKLTEPIKNLSKEAIDAILYGTKGEKLQLHYEKNEGFGVIQREFEGIVNNLDRRYKETQSQSMRADIEECMAEIPCPDCGGRRLKKSALAVTVGGLSIAEFTDLSVIKALEFINGLKLTGKKASDCKVVLNGSGAAGIAIAKLLINYGFRNVILCDRKGMINKSNANNPVKKEMAEITNLNQESGVLADALKGADIFIGVSAPNCVTADMVKTMNTDPMIFALANPDPEILPETAKAAGARIIGTGRSDFPNQINNVLVFPGLFRGALDVRAKAITEEMKMAAAKALAALIDDSDLTPDYIIPDAFDTRVAAAVAKAVADEAIRSNITK